MASGVNSSNFMYAEERTPGGYPLGASRQENRTGLYRTTVKGEYGISAGIPFTPLTVPASDMRKARQGSRYTYRGYAVADFDDTELVGFPGGAFPAINGGVGYDNVRALGNTTAELNRIASWPSKNLQEIQTVAVKNGWLPKAAANGRPNKQTMSLVAFLMEQGNRTGYRWQEVMKEGPEWLRRIGGADVTTGTLNGDGSGSGYDGPVTSVSKSVNYSTKASARNLLRQALSDVLGRGPKDEEVDEFLDLLRSKEKANPTVTTTISDSNDEGSFNSSDQTTEGGFDGEQAAALAERFATNINPEQASRYKRAGYEQLLDSLIMGG